MSGVARIVTVAALLVGFCWFSAEVKTNRWKEVRGVGPLEAGAPAPPLELPDLQGKRVALHETAAARRLVVVAFWATWCGPCHTELAELARLYERHASDGLEVLAVSVDRDPDAARRYAEREEMPFPVLLDPERAALERYGVQALPTSVLVAPDGTVLRAVEGLRPYLPTQIEYHLREADA